MPQKTHNTESLSHPNLICNNLPLKGDGEKNYVTCDVVLARVEAKKTRILVKIIGHRIKLSSQISG